MYIRHHADAQYINRFKESCPLLICSYKMLSLRKIQDVLPALKIKEKINDIVYAKYPSE